jgi:tetratricopeptide (TPR) repeat protein
MTENGENIPQVPDAKEGFQPSGAAILAPPSAFANGQFPPGAMVMIPIGANGEALPKPLTDGPVALTNEQMWKLMGFNGPAVQVQDQEGRPVLIGLEDLLTGLETAYKQDMANTQNARVYAQELMKHQRWEKAEQVVGRMVARGGDAEDWKALGVVQLAQEKFDKAEGTLKGAANLKQDDPIPHIHLARVYEGKKDIAQQKASLLKAIDIAGNFLDAWVGLYLCEKDHGAGEDAAIAEIEKLADQDKNKKFAAPYIALQGMYAANDSSREKALTFAKKAVERAGDDPLALLSLSALYGQKNQLDEIEKLLRPHESKMLTDVRLANNYFECLWQSRQIDKATRFLNTLVRAENAQVKAFAQERAQAVAKHLQRLQAQATGAAKI